MLSRALLCLAFAFGLAGIPALAQDDSSGGAPSGVQEKSFANGLYMTGTFLATYGTNYSTVTINLDRIENNSFTRTTGTLRLSYWATTSYPARGAGFTGYKLATFATLSPLSPQYYYYDIVRSSSMLVPPNGTYWLVLALEEFDSVNCFAADHYCIEDSFISYEQRTFGPSSYTLSVSKSGSGSGTVSSSPGGISCPGTCAAAYAPGTAVQLFASPSPGSTFTGWGGSCFGTGGCVVTMNSATSVSASFALNTADVSVVQTVNANPASAGKDVIFTMTASNNGPTAATGVTVYASYDAAASVVWVSPECVVAAPATYGCIVGTMSPGTSAQYKLVLRKGAGSVYNNAGVSTSTPDSNAGNNTFNLAVAVNPSPPGTAILRYRLYSPVTREHHFTTDFNEYTVLGSFAGTWVQEGTVGKMLNNPGTFNGVAATPYYRLYNNGNQQHHWTSDPNEYYTLIRFPGWSGEGVDGYILPTFATGSVQLYRLNYPFVAGLHHWTIDPFEYAALINAYGWIGEGGSGFAIQ